MRILRINLIILFAVAAFSCNRDKSLFEEGEAAFNNGKIPEAKVIYTQFTKEYPTSQWRQLAETQLTKCNRILELQSSADEFQHSENFDKAIKSYLDISSINTYAIDTATILPSLREKSVIRDSVFLSDLASFLFNLNADAQLTIWGASSIDQVTSRNEVHNELFAEGIKKVMSSQSLKKLQDTLSNLYLKIKSPPEKYAAAVSEIEKSYSAYKELNNTLNHLENYSRFTLRSQLAKLNNEITSSINNLEIFLPKSIVEKYKKSKG